MKHTRLRTIEVRLYDPSNKEVVKTFKLKAPPRHHFSDEGVMENVERVIATVDHHQPNNGYKLVALKNQGTTAIFNLVWDEEKAKASEAKLVEMLQGTVGAEPVHTQTASL